MFCVSDCLRPAYHHHHRHEPPAATTFIPAAYDQQAMMVSVLPSRQTLMTNFQPVSLSTLPPSQLSLTLCEFQQGTPPTPSCPNYDGLSPAKLKAARQRQIRATTGNSASSGITSFRIADILDWRVGSGRQHASATERTELGEVRRSSAGTRSIVRPWDERRSSSSVLSSSPSEVAERNDDDDDEVADIDVEDACCSLPSDTTSDRNVCPLGALLRMTNQTNFDKCANRLQECVSDGRYHKYL